MATSLKCGQCGALLKNVAEAQNHSEITGHTQFEESTEVLKFQVCTACGKKCRTDAEQGLHRRMNPGHDTFVEQSANEVVHTEVEMKDAQDALNEEAALLKQAFGKKAASQPAATATPAASAAAADASTSTATPEELVEMVVPEVSPDLLSQMQDMGFPPQRCVRALHLSGTTTLEGAINWLMEHEGDMDIDEPLLVPKESAKSLLSKDEARAKAEELMRKAKERREREEKEAEKKRELERIRAGKELQKAAEKEKEMAMKRLAEQRQREKEEDARYRAELARRMEDDRKERRRRLGLPEELTEEEKAREAEKQRKAAEEEAEKKKIFSHVKPVSVLSRLREQLVAIKKAHAEAPALDAFKTACTTMIKYLANINAQPDEDKFRNIKLSNAAFQSRVSSVEGCVEFLKTTGFTEADGVLAMARERVNVEVLQGAAAVLNEALTNPFFGAL